MHKLVTKQDAKEVAEQGLVKALECSIEHHKNGLVTSLELQVALDRREFNIGPSECALCRYFAFPNNCIKCPLGPCGCCDEWRKLDKFLNIFINDPSNANHAAFVEAEKVMIARLEEELEKVVIEERAKSKAEAEIKNNLKSYKCSDRKYWFEPKEKKAELELRHGDYGFTDDGHARIVIKCQDKLMQSGITNIPESDCTNKMEGRVIGNIFDLIKKESCEKSK